LSTEQVHTVTNPETGEQVTYITIDFDDAVRDITAYLRETGVPATIGPKDVPMRGMARPRPHEVCTYSPFFKHVRMPEAKAGGFICMYCRVKLLRAADGKYVPEVAPTVPGTKTGRMSASTKMLSNVPREQAKEDG